MKKILPISIAAATFVTGMGLSTMAAAESPFSANVGIVSDYYFRGSNLGDAGAYGGVDFEKNGFYAGTWWIDDGGAGNDGLETDFYLGYGHEYESGFSVGLGLTRYDYTYTSDYEQEINVNLGYGQFGFEYSTGTDEDIGKHGDADVDTDYDFIALSWSGDVFGVTVGSFDADTDADEDDYTYIEASASGEIVAGIDAGVTLGVKSDDGTGSGTDDGYLFLDISKSFDL